MSDGPHIIGPTYRELEAERDALKAQRDLAIDALSYAMARTRDDVIEAPMSLARTHVESHDALKARCERLVKLLREVTEPGVFGPWKEVPDPALIDSQLDLMCVQKGYGAVLHHVAWLWQQRHPGSAHTVAASHNVRIRIIREIQAELDAIDKENAKCQPDHRPHPARPTRRRPPHRVR